MSVQHAKNIILKHNAFLISLLVFLISGSFLTFLVIYIDDTNFGTGNGLWKSVFIKDYMFHRDTIDYKHLKELSYITNLLYFPVYSWLIQYSPLHYFDFILVRKMAIINSWFGALSLGAFYYVMRLLTKSDFASIVAVLFHLGCGIFLSLSTNSDDFIPAYAFFVVSLIFAIKYIQTDSIKSLSLTAVFYCIAWLFHWTIGAASAFPFGLMIIFKHKFSKTTLKHLALFTGINLALSGFMALIFGVWFFQLLYPGKLMGTGLMGWAWIKLVLLYTGFVQYIIGGFQFLGWGHFKDSLLGSNWYYPSFIASSVILIALGGYAVYLFRRERKNVFLRNTFLLILTTFFFAQMMNLYESATDLQFHIQPMIWVPITYGFLALQAIQKFPKRFSGINKSLVTAVLAIILISFPLLLLGYNIKKYRLPGRQGLDTFYSNQIKKLEGKFDLHTTFFITRGWDEFGNWGYATWGNELRLHTLTVTDFLRDYPRESIEDAARRMRDSITIKLNSGYMVLTGPEIIDRPESEIVDIFAGFQQEEKTKKLIETVKEFKRTPFVKTELGTFYQLQEENEPISQFDNLKITNAKR